VIGTAPSAPSGGRFAALRSRNFRILWLGLFSSNAGAQVQLVAQAWLVLQMTDSALSLGILAASFAAPMIALPLFGGALADQFDRITILKVTQIAQVLLRGSLAGLVALGVADVATMYLFQFASAAILAFDNPPRQAILPGIVPRADLLSATSLMSVIWTGAQLVGPALGGWLLPIVGPAWLFAIGGATAFASLAATFALRDVPNRLERRPEPLAEHLFGGVRFAWADRASLALLVQSAAVSGVISCYYTLLPIFARDLWRAGPETYGLLAAMPGLGSLVGGVAVAMLGDLRRKDLLALGASVAFGAALGLYTSIPPVAVGAALLVVAGIASATFAACVGTLLQLRALGPIRGRVMSLYAITHVGLSSLGGLGGGALAERIGPPDAVRVAVLLAVVVVAALSIIVARRMPASVPHT